MVKVFNMQVLMLFPTYLLGIMSFGSENCGGLRIPSVYTSIAHFYNWIQDNIPAE